MLGNLLGGFIVILIGVTLIPTIANVIFDATTLDRGNGTFQATNITGTSIALLNITTIFFALGVMASGVALAVTGLKNAGMV